MEKEIKQLIKKYPMRFKKLKRYFKCYTKEEKEALRNTLEEMCVNGDIYFDGCTYTSMPKNYIVVRVEEMKKNKKTPFKACFVLDSGKVIPIMEDDLNGSLIGDKVILNLKERRVVSVLKREQSVVFCEVIEKDGIKELKPLRVLGAENLYMRISSKSMKKLVIGDIITVNLSTIKSDDIYEADFLSKVGNRRDTSLALKVIAAKHGFYEEYKSDALKELKNIPENVTESDLLDRVDLRNKNIFTIDGVHTKDMDDAVGLTTLEDGNYELIVSIADVAYYIKRNSHLYKEALKRGTSLYMVDTVIPMLPPTISNGICSLNEGVDRLTLSCIIKITPGGKVLSYDVVKSVINSKKKMNYEAVLKVLNGESVTGYDEFRKTLLKMNKLALKLKQKRDLISFASGDIAYTFNDDKEIIDFKKEPSTMATNIIERFMILANHLVSMYSTFLSLPTPYRVHEKPTIDSLETLYQKLKLLSFEIDDCLVNNNYETLKNILAKYQDKPEYNYLSNLILRTMKRAKYSSYNIGHYALKERYYSHFTSPIRRLPDLLLHYQIHSILDNTYPENVIEEDKMEELCYHASFMEREADMAEKEADEYVIINYMASHLDRFYTGYVEDITESNVTIRTKEDIKGYVSLLGLDSLTKDLKNGTLKSGEHLILKVGDTCLIKALQVNVLSGEIEFIIEKNLTERKYEQDYTYVLKRVM
mgnify:CR=1 FL=1